MNTSIGMQRISGLIAMILSLIVSGVSANGRTTYLPPAPVPVLTWKLEMPPDRRELPGFHGLLIEHWSIHYIYPFLPYIFFNIGSAEFAVRYHVLNDTATTSAFAEHLISGSTFEKHYDVLNLLGSRMQRNPASAITLTGCNSRQPTLGETRDVSQQRAERVREYLVRIWNIDPQRIRIEARDLPTHASDNSDERGREENRRVEIACNDWEIMKVIDQHWEVRGLYTEMMKFGMKNGIADDDVASRRIEILRGGKLWHVIGDTLLGLQQIESPPYNWGKWGDKDSIPQDDLPYVARLIVQSRSGTEYKSAAVKIPVKEVPSEELKYLKNGHYYCFGERTYSFFTILLFDFNHSALDKVNEQTFQRIICNSIGRYARVTIACYSDTLESARFHDRVKNRRTREVIKKTKRCMVEHRVTGSLNERANRDCPSIYSNDSPEGRCFNRTVQILVENPVHPLDE